jgi:putative sterol carrier protein
MVRSDTADAESYYFPSQAWFSEYRERINDDAAYAEQAADWGTEFNGDFVFEMADMPVEELDTDAMPDDLAQELDRYVRAEDGSYVGYAFLGLEGGECTAARLIEGPEEVEAGFTLSADHDTWKQLMAGEVGVVDGVMSGHFEIDGDMQKVMQYSQAAVRLTETAAEIDAEFADEVFAK